MKILTVLTYYRPHTSGLTIYAERLARAFVKRGHQVTVMTTQFDPSLPREETMDGIKVIRVPVAARFAAEKGIEVLLDALPTILKKYPKAQVLFAGTYQNVMGEQAYSDRLMPRIREYEVAGHWKFLGNLDPVEMAAFYPNLDIITVPSLNSTEAFGLVQIEAMINGVPCVPSALPGVRQPVIMHGMGRVARIGDSADLAESILEVLDEPQKFRGDVEAIKKTYNPDSIAQEYEKLFKS